MTAKVWYDYLIKEYPRARLLNVPLEEFIKDADLFNDSGIILEIIRILNSPTSKQLHKLHVNPQSRHRYISTTKVFNHEFINKLPHTFFDKP